MQVEAVSRSAAEAPVTGGVRIWLRAEGLSVLLLSLLLYRYCGLSWWIFLALLLTPDAITLFYLINPRIGGAAYNVVHSYLLPVTLASLAIFTERTGIIPYLCIWTAHIGMDRVLGFGLKYPTAFGRTHLGFLHNLPKPADPTD
jgi:hypothetical protein